jgi:hypothetical protein
VAARAFPELALAGAQRSANGPLHFVVAVPFAAAPAVVAGLDDELYGAVVRRVQAASEAPLTEAPEPPRQAYFGVAPAPEPKASRPV